MQVLVPGFQTQHEGVLCIIDLRPPRRPGEDPAYWVVVNKRPHLRCDRVISRTKISDNRGWRWRITWNINVVEEVKDTNTSRAGSGCGGPISRARISDISGRRITWNITVDEAVKDTKTSRAGSGRGGLDVVAGTRDGVAITTIDGGKEVTVVLQIIPANPSGFAVKIFHVPGRAG